MALTRWFVKARPRPDEEGETISRLFKKHIVATRVIASIGWIGFSGFVGPGS